MPWNWQLHSERVNYIPAETDWLKSFKFWFFRVSFSNHFLKEHNNIRLKPKIIMIIFGLMSRLIALIGSKLNIYLSRIGSF